MDQILASLNLNAVFFFIALVFCDMLLGAARAATAGEFRLQNLPLIFNTKVVPFSIAILVMAAIKAAATGTDYSTTANYLFYAATAAICAGVLGSIIENLILITGKQIELPGDPPVDS